MYVYSCIYISFSICKFVTKQGVHVYTYTVYEMTISRQIKVVANKDFWTFTKMDFDLPDL